MTDHEHQVTAIGFNVPQSENIVREVVAHNASLRYGVPVAGGFLVVATGLTVLSLVDGDSLGVVGSLPLWVFGGVISGLVFADCKFRGWLKTNFLDNNFISDFEKERIANEIKAVVSASFEQMKADGLPVDAKSIQFGAPLKVKPKVH